LGEGIEVSVNPSNVVKVKGKKATLEFALHNSIKASVGEGRQLILVRGDENKSNTFIAWNVSRFASKCCYWCRNWIFKKLLSFMGLVTERM
jgi:ribosomal protein L6P/L9E